MRRGLIDAEGKLVFPILASGWMNTRSSPWQGTFVMRRLVAC